jgi:hypothetical protein
VYPDYIKEKDYLTSNVSGPTTSLYHSTDDLFCTVGVFGAVQQPLYLTSNMSEGSSSNMKRVCLLEKGLRGYRLSFGWSEASAADVAAAVCRGSILLAPRAQRRCSTV